MAPNEEPATFGAKPAGEGRKSRASSTSVSPTLVAFTIETETGRVVNMEGVDAQGARSELSDDARAKLAEKADKATLEAVIEQAFEAGIDCVLGAEDDPESAESDEDADLRRILVRSLIRRSAAHRLLQREVLSRAAVGALIQHAARQTEGGATH